MQCSYGTFFFPAPIAIPGTKEETEKDAHKRRSSPANRKKKSMGDQKRPLLGCQSPQPPKGPSLLRALTPVPGRPLTPGSGKGPHHLVVLSTPEAFQTMTLREGRPPYCDSASMPAGSQLRDKSALRPAQQSLSPRHRSPVYRWCPNTRPHSSEQSRAGKDRAPAIGPWMPSTSQQSNGTGPWNVRGHWTPGAGPQNLSPILLIVIESLKTRADPETPDGQTPHSDPWCQNAATLHTVLKDIWSWHCPGPQTVAP